MEIEPVIEIFSELAFPLFRFQHSVSGGDNPNGGLFGSVIANWVILAFLNKAQQFQLAGW